MLGAGDIDVVRRHGRLRFLPSSGDRDSILRSLPEEYRLPLTLRYIGGADYETICTQLGLTNGSLRGLLHRGLQLLRAKLPQDFGGNSM